MNTETIAYISSLIESVREIMIRMTSYDKKYKGDVINDSITLYALTDYALDYLELHALNLFEHNEIIKDIIVFMQASNQIAADLYSEVKTSNHMRDDWLIEQNYVVNTYITNELLDEGYRLWNDIWSLKNLSAKTTFYMQSPTSAKFGLNDIVNLFRRRKIPKETQEKAEVYEQKVESSNLDVVRYNPSENILQIIFKSGGIYIYFDVPETVWERLISASSHGEYFHQYIKNKYKYERQSG